MSDWWTKFEKPIRGIAADAGVPRDSLKYVTRFLGTADIPEIIGILTNAIRDHVVDSSNFSHQTVAMQIESELLSQGYPGPLKIVSKDVGNWESTEIIWLP